VSMRVIARPILPISHKITSQAELTTFSDHIVASYPCIVRPTTIAEENWHFFWCLGEK
jgi:hypothetical protein